jgi:plasmid stabilization system protein ParE
MKVVFSKEAENDVVENAHYIAQSNPKVGAEVFDRVWETCQLLASLPTMGTPINSLFDTSQLGEKIQELLNAQPLLAEMRRFPVKKFKKLIAFYRVVNNELHVERILHGRRDLPVVFSDMFV